MLKKTSLSIHLFFITFICFGIAFASSVNTSLIPSAYAKQSSITQQKNIAFLLGSIQKAYASMSSFSASFTQTLHHAESNSEEHRTGTLLFSKPCNARWETKAPNEELFVVNDKAIWNYIPDEDIAYRYPISALNNSIPLLQIITGKKRLDQDFTIESEPNSSGHYALKLYPKEPSTQLVEMLIVIDSHTFLLKSAEIIDFYGNTNIISFEAMTQNKPIAKDNFSFTPPQGVIVEER